MLIIDNQKQLRREYILIAVYILAFLVIFSSNIHLIGKLAVGLVIFLFIFVSAQKCYLLHFTDTEIKAFYFFPKKSNVNINNSNIEYIKTREKRGKHDHYVLNIYLVNKNKYTLEFDCNEEQWANIMKFLEAHNFYTKII